MILFTAAAFAAITCAVTAQGPDPKDKDQGVVAADDPFPEAEYVIDLDPDNFDEFVLSDPDSRTAVMFYVKWCRYCRQSAPQFEAAAKQLQNDTTVKFCRLDVTAYPDLANRFDAGGSFPTFKVFSGPLDGPGRTSPQTFPAGSFQIASRFIDFALGIDADLRSDVGAPIFDLYHNTFQSAVVDWLDEPIASEAPAGISAAALGTKVVVGYFHTSTCDACDAFSDSFDGPVAAAFRNEPAVRLARIDCQDFRDGGGAKLCQAGEKETFPTIIAWKQVIDEESGLPKAVVPSEGVRYALNRGDAVDLVTWVNTVAQLRRAPGGLFAPSALSFPELTKALAAFEDLSVEEIDGIPNVIDRTAEIAKTLRDAGHALSEATELIADVVHLAIKGGEASGGVSKAEGWGGSIIKHEIDFAEAFLSSTVDVPKTDVNVTALRRAADVRLSVLASLRSLDLLRGKQIRRFAESLGLKDVATSSDVYEARAALKSAVNSDSFDRDDKLLDAEGAANELAREQKREREAREARLRLMRRKSMSGVKRLGDTTEAFRDLVFTEGQRYLVIFVTPDCDACKTIEDEIEKAAETAAAEEEKMRKRQKTDYAPLTVGKVNLRVYPWLSAPFHYQYTPTVLYFPAVLNPDFVSLEVENATEAEMAMTHDERMAAVHVRMPKIVTRCHPPRTAENWLVCAKNADAEALKIAEAGGRDAVEVEGSKPRREEEEVIDADADEDDEEAARAKRERAELAKIEKENAKRAEREANEAKELAARKEKEERLRLEKEAAERAGVAEVHKTNVELKEGDLERHLLARRCVLVRLCTSWSGPCKASAKAWETFAASHGGDTLRHDGAEATLVVASVNLDGGEAGEAAWAHELFQVSKFPSTLLFSAGSASDQYVAYTGPLKVPALREHAESHCFELALSD